MRSVFIIISLFFSSLSLQAGAAHEHQGKIPKIHGKPKTPSLTAAEIAKLDAGKPVFKIIQVNGQEQGLSVQDIKADAATIWATITDFANYPKMVDKLQEIEVYGPSKTDPKIRFKVGTFGIYYEYFIHHTLNIPGNYMTWHLDYSRQSEIDDSVGFWLLEPHPTKPGVYRLYYSLKMLLKGWVPGAVKNYMQKQGVKTATSWVKKYSEK